jgi:hypothetical protein
MVQHALQLHFASVNRRAGRCAKRKDGLGESRTRSTAFEIAIMLRVSIRRDRHGTL